MRPDRGKPCGRRHATAAARLGGPGPGLWGFTIPAAVAVLTFLAFLPTLDNGFVDWDDISNLGENESYRGVGWTQLTWMFTTFHMGHYIPLTWLTFGLDYVVWGMDPFGYHLTNLVLHAANAVLVFLIAVRLLTLAVTGLSSEWLGLRLAAMTAALLFSLHPLRVESVVWATERRDVLCGFFYLLAILAYLRACEARSAVARGRRLWYGAAVAAFAGALLSKSMAVSLPVVLLLLDIYPLRRLVLDRAILKEPRQRLVLAEKIPFVILSAAAAVVAIVAVRHGALLASMSALGVLERVSIANFSLAFYLWKMLASINLSPLYEMPDAIRWWMPGFIPGGLVVIAVTGLAVGLRRRRPALAAVWASYIAILLPRLRHRAQRAPDHGGPLQLSVLRGLGAPGCRRPGRGLAASPSYAPRILDGPADPARRADRHRVPRCADLATGGNLARHGDALGACAQGIPFGKSAPRDRHAAGREGATKRRGRPLRAGASDETELRSGAHCSRSRTRRPGPPGGRDQPLRGGGPGQP